MDRVELTPVLLKTKLAVAPEESTMAAGKVRIIYPFAGKVV